MATATVGTSPYLYRATHIKDTGLPGESFVISNTTMIAALPPGPLRRLLEVTYASAAAAQAALRDSPNVDLRIVALNTNTTDPTVNQRSHCGVTERRSRDDHIGISTLDRSLKFYNFLKILSMSALSLSNSAPLAT